MSAATGLSAGVTVANRLGALSLSAVSSSPQSLGEGKLWLLGTSALIADRPAVPSLLGFWIAGFAVLLVCSTRIVVGAAVVGHTLSTVGVYTLLMLTRLVDPHAFASAVSTADYGLSAIIDAWLGAIAAVSWMRWRGRVTRAAVVAGAVACAGVGLALRPDVGVLDTEHILAFAIGVAAATRGWRRSLAWPPGACSPRPRQPLELSAASSCADR